MALIGSVTVSAQPLNHGVGMAPLYGVAHSATHVPKPLPLPKIMLTRVELDQRRADFMETLYDHYQADHLYTGIWERFAYDVAANVRDLDYSVLRADLIRAFGVTDSELANRYADTAITVLTSHLLPQS
jgi:hypothetical protein